MNLSSEKVRQCLEFSSHFSPCVDRIVEIISALSGGPEEEGSYWMLYRFQEFTNFNEFQSRKPFHQFKTVEIKSFENAGTC